MAVSSPWFGRLRFERTFWLTLAVAVVVSAGGMGAVRWAMRHGGSATSRAFLSRLAFDLNKSLPRMVDRETELVSVSADEGVMVYNYRFVNRTVSEMSHSDLLRSVRPGAMARTCSEPATRDALLARGVTMRFSYMGRRRLRIGAFEVSASDCGL